jgi:hypothetical protein
MTVTITMNDNDNYNDNKRNVCSVLQLRCFPGELCKNAGSIGNAPNLNLSPDSNSNLHSHPKSQWNELRQTERSIVSMVTSVTYDTQDEHAVIYP